MATTNMNPLITGVSVMDAQHQIFFDWLHRMEDAMAAGPEAGVVPLMIEDLSQYLDLHFGTEERLMRAHEYPFRETHTLEHLKSRESLRLLARELDDCTVGLAALDKLKRWFHQHVLNWDAKLGTFLKARGVA